MSTILAGPTSIDDEYETLLINSHRKRKLLWAKAVAAAWWHSRLNILSGILVRRRFAAARSSRRFPSSFTIRPRFK